MKILHLNVSENGFTKNYNCSRRERFDLLADVDAYFAGLESHWGEASSRQTKYWMSPSEVTLMVPSRVWSRSGDVLARTSVTPGESVVELLFTPLGEGSSRGHFERMEKIVAPFFDAESFRRVEVMGCDRVDP